MCAKKKGDGVFDEPWWGSDCRPDPSESRAQRNKALNRGDSELDAADHSVWDEPTLAGDPAAHGAPGYGALMAQRRAATGKGATWAIVLAAALASGPVAVASALLLNQQTALGILAVVLFAPVVEEPAKVILPLYFVEKRPWLFANRFQILLCAAAGGVAFGAIENLLYLGPSVLDFSQGLTVWRWTICAGMHVVCALISGVGLMHVWQDAWERSARPRIALAAPYLVAAMVLHGAYNALAVALSVAGFTP